jgi:hypothetical protein
MIQANGHDAQFSNRVAEVTRSGGIRQVQSGQGKLIVERSSSACRQCRNASDVDADRVGSWAKGVFARRRAFSRFLIDSLE